MAFSQEQREILAKLEPIFFGHALRRRQELFNEGGRLAHYTTAENAIKIIRSGELWLRDTRCMTDFREVTHGYEMLG